MIQVPEMLELYEAEARGKSMSAYNAALKDYLSEPEVFEIDTSDYSGMSGGQIRILAVDDVVVRSVEVAIVADGEIVEQR
jgi:hypothetical protein